MKDAFSSDLAPASEGLCSKALPAMSPGETDAVPAWDSAEALVEIQRLVAAGLTTRQIGERWGVSRNAVQKRLGREREKARLGVKQDPSLPAWRSEDADVELLRLRREGRKPVEIARLFGVSASAVFKRLSALPEHYEPTRRAPVPDVVPEWGSEDAGKVMVGLHGGGWSQAEIAALFGVTDNAVRKRLRRLAARTGKPPERDESTSGDGSNPASPGARSSRAAATFAGREPDGANVTSSLPDSGGVSQDPTPTLQVALSALPSWDSPHSEDALRRLRDAGMPLAEIARRFGVSRSTLRDRLARLKIIQVPSPPPRQEPGEREKDDLVELKPVPVQDFNAKSPLDMASLIVPSGCRWPMWGNDERPTHVYCGKPVLRTRWPGVYCEECRAKAFRRIAVMVEA